MDSAFVNALMPANVSSETISLAKEIDTISDHYPVVVEFDIVKHNKSDASDGPY